MLTLEAAAQHSNSVPHYPVAKSMPLEEAIQVAESNHVQSAPTMVTVLFGVVGIYLNTYFSSIEFPRA